MDENTNKYTLKLMKYDKTFLDNIPLILHVGTRKTGSSALQRFLCKNEDLLKQHDIYYPPHGINENGISSGHFVDVLKKLYDQEQLTEHVRTIFDLCKKNNYTLLLSSEILYSLPKKTHKLFPQAKIIIYLRRQDSYYEAQYIEYVKRRLLTNKCHEFSKTKEKFRLDELSLVHKWVALYGMENVTIRPYEIKQFKDEDIVNDFLDILHIEPSTDTIMQRDKINTSWGKNVVEYKRQINILLKKCCPNSLMHILQEYSDENREQKDWPYSFLSPEKRLEIVEASQKDMDIITHDYLKLEDKSFFRDTFPDLNQEWKAYPGLSKKKIYDITTFIVKKMPGFIIVLTKKTKNRLALLKYGKNLGMLYKSWRCLMNMMKKNKYCKIIRTSGILDAAWYLEQYPDVKQADDDPVKHYLTHGWKEGRDPSPGFSTNNYLNERPDVARTGICPLVHYILHGIKEQEQK